MSLQKDFIYAKYLARDNLADSVGRQALCHTGVCL